MKTWACGGKTELSARSVDLDDELQTARRWCMKCFPVLNFGPYRNWITGKCILFSLPQANSVFVNASSACVE